MLLGHGRTLSCQISGSYLQPESCSPENVPPFNARHSLAFMLNIFLIVHEIGPQYRDTRTNTLLYARPRQKYILPNSLSGS